MTERLFPYHLTAERAPRLGLVVLQADETIEGDFRRLVPPEVELLVSRVPSGREVTPDTLTAMADDLAGAASLFPEGSTFDALAYACTSGAAQIGPARVAELLRPVLQARAVTDPVTALIAACRKMGLGRIALLSPYTAPVSAKLRAALSQAGIETPICGSFGVAEEAIVARIASQAILDACAELVASEDVDGLFLSCTNLRVLDLIAPLETRLGMPVLSSNLVLAWHLLTLAGRDPSGFHPARLFG
ncbi:Asp/Glu racemase [Brevirhabdus pacifica]|uniref:Asp/Glu racemase n=2 Tax=Brevirhabdus pacifica TaxID=1267768 RepID=A0A1U7DH77_9RHOB|nr:Asp/Glu racemase [Brevirhabdus pacifica]OWU76712.1 Asp/Glu racemase [Loktanella sp. 22II-4b]PJJ86150.1 maleate isomerase [Brevirhabdus pacifica]